MFALCVIKKRRKGTEKYMPNGTSLKIFKHYKLKPSFPIMIKDNKTKDRAGVGEPPPPSFVRSINPNLIQKLIRTDITQFRFDPIWSILIQ